MMKRHRGRSGDVPDGTPRREIGASTAERLFIIMAPLPSFAATTEPLPARSSPAAARLGMSPAGVDKLIRPRVLSPLLEAAVVDKLAVRPFLEVADGSSPSCGPTPARTRTPARAAAASSSTSR